MFPRGMIYTKWLTRLLFGINNSYLCHNFLAITRDFPSGGYNICSRTRVTNQWPCIARRCTHYMVMYTFALVPESLVTSSLKNQAQVEEHGPLTDTRSSSIGHGGPIPIWMRKSERWTRLVMPSWWKKWLRRFDSIDHCDSLPDSVKSKE